MIGQNRVSIDSRTIAVGDIFIALEGTRFRGIDFVGEALERGASGVVFAIGEESAQAKNQNKDQKQIAVLQRQYQERQFIEVADTSQYLKSLATTHLCQWKKSGGKVIGITGSNGKTTTKEMLAFMIKELIGDELLYNQGNFNNQVGVPLTILRLSHRHKLAIIEMGTNQKGEIQILCDIAMPDMGIITNISGTHLAYLESVEGVFQEKRALFDAVMSNTEGQGVFIINADNPHLRALSENQNVVTFGTKFGTRRIRLGVNEVQLAEETLKNDFITGDHNLVNLTCAFLMAGQLFPYRIAELKAAVTRFRPTLNRSSWIRSGQTDIFLDAYNANPASMEAAIMGLCRVIEQRAISQERILWIVGDMNELGERSEVLHQELGKILRSVSAVHIIFLGQHYAAFKQGFQGGESAGDFYHFNNVDGFKKTLGEKYLNLFELVFIKGSRSLQLESLIDIN